jgi:hypothetical protein
MELFNAIIYNTKLILALKYPYINIIVNIINN